MTRVEVDAELLGIAEEIHDGWFADRSRIDWEEFIDRLEKMSGIDMGDSMLADHIRAIQRHIRAYRRL